MHTYSAEQAQCRTAEHSARRAFSHKSTCLHCSHVDLSRLKKIESSQEVCVRFSPTAVSGTSSWERSTWLHRKSRRVPPSISPSMGGVRAESYGGTDSGRLHSPDSGGNFRWDPVVYTRTHFRAHCEQIVMFRTNCRGREDLSTGAGSAAHSRADC